MQMRDILWAISLPFRIYNSKELDINKFAFTLSFDAGLPSCDISTARKLISIALEKDWIERDRNMLHAKFEPWQPKFYPPTWKPNFSDLDKNSMVDLIPLEASIEYKPQIIERVKPKIVENKPLFSSRTSSEDVEFEAVEEEEVNEERADEKKDKKSKVTPKKSGAKKKKKMKGQKSISDFFG